MSKRRPPSGRPQRSPSGRRPRREQRAERPPHERIYLLLWKPYGVLSQFSTDSRSAAPTLKSLISTPEVYPAGRLDRDSEGLLLLTNDGVSQHKLCDPRYGHWRTYWVQVERTPTEEALNQLRSGVSVRGKQSKPARVERLASPPDLPPRDPPIRVRQSVETAWISISLHEGMNRQVRRMTASVGFPTLRLIRAEIELPQDTRLTLSGLSPGASRVLSPTEISAVNTLRASQPRSAPHRSHQREARR